jgi:CRISPR-associated protein (TIGR03985 family)
LRPIKIINNLSYARGLIFPQIDSKMAKTLVKNAKIIEVQKKQIISNIETHPADIYCLIDYRENDNNIIMRLRAWGDNVEVMLPEQLRQRMKKDIEQTWQLYRE